MPEKIETDLDGFPTAGTRLGHGSPDGDGRWRVSVERAGKSADRTGSSGMASTAPTTFQDLRSIAFGGDALGLEQQIVL